MVYYNGQGVKKDDRKAADYFTRAANQGDTVAQNKLGIMYQYGRGVARDDTVANTWYQIASSQDNQNATGRQNIVARK